MRALCASQIVGPKSQWLSCPMEGVRGRVRGVSLWIGEILVRLRLRTARCALGGGRRRYTRATARIRRSLSCCLVGARVHPARCVLRRLADVC